MYYIVANRLYQLSAEEEQNHFDAIAEQAAEARNERFWEDRGADDGFDEWEARRGVVTFEQAMSAATSTAPYCGVCHRSTDHFAEHDDLVDLGLATYDASTGDVYRTDEFSTAHGEALRNALDDAVIIWCRQVNSGHVPMIKTVGHVRTLYPAVV